MHVLFCHSQFPAQFGFFAAHVAEQLGWRCTFVCERAAPLKSRVEIITYQKSFGATSHHSYYSRGFENAAAQHEGVYRVLESRPKLKPDLVVGHAGLGGSLFLRELYGAPMLTFFEFYYHVQGSDMDFRPEFPPTPESKLRLILRNAPLLLELQQCDLGYCPTNFQRQLFPREYQPKLHTVFDGIDTSIWRRRTDVPRTWQKRGIDSETRIVTYCSRGFESMRGFDMFMRAAKLIYRRFPNVVFLVVGSERICYGGDQQYIRPYESFKDYVLASDDYDPTKFLFLGQVTVGELANIFSVSDAHIYLTAPFVLSWSMLNAMACGAVVVGSNTAPVTEVIEEGQTGLLADFFNPEQIAERVLEVLREPAAFSALSQRAQALIRDKYSTTVTYPKLLALCEQASTRRPAPASQAAEQHACSQTARPSSGQAPPER